MATPRASPLPPGEGGPIGPGEGLVRGDLAVAFDQKKRRKIPSTDRSATTFSRPIVLFGGESVTVPTSPIPLSGGYPDVQGEAAHVC